ncbi:MAG TPA: hypothetical protein VN201_02115 [Roseateles sp.]|nr:hypothetical protein [Roseateles sp.]
MKTLFAAAAIVFAASASAGTVNFSDFGHQDLTGFGTSFDDSYTLDLGADTWVHGLLTTGALLGGAPAVDVQSVTLRRVGGSSLSWVETIAVDWNVSLDGAETWALSPRLLSAGQWQLEVTGVSYDDKAGNGYNAAVELPEPGSIALASLAIVGAGLASIRRRNA